MPLLIFRLVVLALFGSAVVAEISLNVTIDDTLGDSVTGNQIVYSPADNWQSSSNCSECASTFAMAMVYDRTWTLSTLPGNATISFYADYAEMAFLIDDLLVGTFTFSPSTELYNYPVYTNGELPMGYHTLIIMNGVNETSSGAVLDYIVYTTQPEHLLGIPSTVAQATVTATVYSSSPDAQTRVIVGTVSGIGVFLLLAIGAFVVVLSGDPASERTATTHSTMTTPTRFSIPSMFFIADTSAPLLPARADSVKTLSTKLVPNRHPDMEVPGPLPVLSVPLEGGSTSGTTTLSATPEPGGDGEQSDRRWFTRKSDGSTSGGSRSDSASESSSRRR
ncbi:predicted protein [Postia placenta Mad-698-R]|nr:predicted protein [Postia placenta Mad-698-R]